MLSVPVQLIAWKDRLWNDLSRGTWSTCSLTHWSLDVIVVLRFHVPRG